MRIRAESADLYKSYMDEAAIEAAGLKPLQPHLQAIAAISDKHQLARALGETLRADVDALNMTNFHTENLFGLWVAPGFDDSEHYHAYLMQGGIVLPDREYYVSDSAAMQEIRTKYEQHVATMLKLAGFDDPDKRAARIVALEHAIAQTHWSLADDNDVHKANNSWKPADFASKAPGLDWTEYFRAAGLDKQASFYRLAAKRLHGRVGARRVHSARRLERLARLPHHRAILLPFFPRHSPTKNFLSGARRSTASPNSSLAGNAASPSSTAHLRSELGRLYVQRHFPPEVKAQVQAMVTNLIAVYRQRLQGITWMAPATKAQAIAKLDALYVGIGYPDHWEEENFEVKPDDIVGNLRRSRHGEVPARTLTHRHRGRSQTLVHVTANHQCGEPAAAELAQLPRGYSSDARRSIAHAPAAANYGAIGAVIGHEISHTFDSEGSAFDSKGRLRNWWTKDDFAHFNAVTARLAAQYDAYKPFPDLALNGKQTLAENIADDAGLAAAYDAYKASLNGQAAPEQDGFNGDQQFYIAFAQSWAASCAPQLCATR